MPLNFTSEFTPHIRWMAQARTWKKSTENGQVEFEWEKGAFDLANIETGWGLFAEGEAPEWVMDENNQQNGSKAAGRPRVETWLQGPGLWPSLRRCSRVCDDGDRSRQGNQGALRSIRETDRVPTSVRCP